jgi:thiol-disulfide isomerase/thioredoxin/outer membrane lipoprotein-sorting protein
MPMLRRTLPILVVLACLVGAATAVQAAAPSFADAVGHSREVAESVKSYSFEATLQVSSGMAGMGSAMNMELTAASAAVWPDRLLNTQESTAFSYSLGTGAGGSWLYISQLGTCYQGEPAALVRDLEASAEFELTPESIYNYYSGIEAYLLKPQPAAIGEATEETLTIGGREIPCVVFTLAGSSDEPGEGAPVEGEGKVWYDPATGLVLQSEAVMHVLQGGMQITQTILTSVTSFSLNEAIDEAKFTYTAPEGAKVVDSLERMTNPNSMAGQAAPEIGFTRFDGSTFKLSEHRGKVVFLNFWATWCPPCRMEMPHIQTLFQEMSGRDDVVFIGASSEDAATVKGFLEKNAQYTFPIVNVAQADVSGAYRTDSIPAIFVIDGEGVIQAHLVGAQTEAQMRRALAKAGIGE